MDALEGLLAVDIETKSAVDLKKVGQWKYSRDDSTDVYCVVFGYAEEPDRYTFVEWTPGDALPQGLIDYLEAGGTIIAHNASFEVSIWRNILEPRYGFPPVPLEQWDDTQVRGLALNLPVSLDGLAKTLGCRTQKDEAGSKLMLKMSKLREIEAGVYEPIDHQGHNYDTEANRARLLAYCLDDVGATLDAFFLLKPLRVDEALAYEVDKRVNMRGVYIDRRFAQACIAIVEDRKRELDRVVLELPQMEIADARDPRALKAFLKARGVKIPTRTRKTIADGEVKYVKTESTDKAAVAAMLADPLLDAEARIVLSNRLEATKATSLAKLGRAISMVDGRGSDGRLRFTLQFHGAHTGRWASSGLQVHNLPKDKLGPLALPIRQAIERRDLEALKFLADRPLEAVSSSLRSLVIAPPGRELIAADYSAVEARVLAWLAGQADVLQAFWRGQDVYAKAAADVGSSERQLGKVCVLALGYGMGVVTFANTAAAWGVPLELKVAYEIQKAWRKTNDAIVEFWRALEKVAKAAVDEPGTVFRAGKIRAVATAFCLAIAIPSGRSLRYWKPRIVQTEKTIKTVDAAGTVVEKDVIGEELRYYTIGSDKTTMIEESTYGGKLVENVTQAVARDLLAAATVRVDRHPDYELVMHVHDSLVAEVEAGAGDVEEFCRLISRLPPWAEGLPLVSHGYRDTRFRG